MACNGFNHRPGCSCNFKGGHPIANASSGTVLSRRTFSARVDDARRICPDCRKVVYFFKFRSGGSGAFDTFGPPWLRHPCRATGESYSPFSRSGRPKLRNRRSEYERDGWIPIDIRNVEEFPKMVIIHGNVLDRPEVIHIGLDGAWSVDQEMPTYIRYECDGRIKVSFFAMNSESFVDLYGILDCLNPMDVILNR